MGIGATLFMTPEESARVQKTIQDRQEKCLQQTGQSREPKEVKSLTQEAVGQSLMDDLASAAFGLGKPKESKDTMVTYAVGCPYLPCTAALSDLKPMKLSELCMETHHRGRVLSLRRASPTVKLKASSWAAVQQDGTEDADKLELFLHNSRYGQDILDSGSVFSVKEPYYTLNNQNEPVIRVDHPSDIVISVYSDDAASWRNATSSADSAPPSKPANKWREEGNAALEKNDYLTTYTSYTEGLKAISDSDAATLRNDLHRNRSYVNLVLQRYDEAGTDATSSLTRGTEEKQKLLDAKAFYRAGTAAYSLGDFDKAKELFQEQEKIQPDDRILKINLRRTDVRLKEKENGTYDLRKIVTALPKTKYRADAANFDGRTKAKKSPGAGRGLFATRDLEADEIIMAEKAFCIVWSTDAGAFSTLTCDLRDDAAIRVFPAGLHRAVVQKLVNNPSQIEKVLDLFGDYEGLGKKRHEADGSPVIDTFQIHDIVQRNAFGPGKQNEDEDISNASTGLWIRAAYINHSCIPNARLSYAGDLMVIRATRRIRAGEEIVHPYDESSDYDARAEMLQRTWGFKCKCKLCVAEAADAPEVREKRQGLEKDVNEFLQRENPAQSKMVAVVRAKRMRQALLDTYDEKRYKELPKLALRGIDQWLEATKSK